MPELIDTITPHDDPTPTLETTSIQEGQAIVQALVRDFSQPRTGIQDVDALLSLTKWDTLDLSFGFPANASDYPARYAGRTAPNREPDIAFAQAPAALQVAVQAAAQQLQDLTDLTLTQVTDQMPDIAVAVSGRPAVGYAYPPGPDAASGDIWIKDQLVPGTPNPNLTPVRGDSGWFGALHELGHAVGLKHPHETGERVIVVKLPFVPDIRLTIPGPFVAARPERDSLEFSVMSYRSYIGASVDTLTNEPFGFPQTFMMDDIRALQEMYGADFETRSGDTIYQFNPMTGEVTIDSVAQGAPGANRLFLTIWDGGGTDTYDFSSYSSNLAVDLSPGGWSVTSPQQLAYLGDGEFARGNVFNALQFRGDPRSLIENAIGGSGNDRLLGNAANNEIFGGFGQDSILGRDGQDTLIGDVNVDDSIIPGFFSRNDQLFGGAGDDFLFGDARIMRGFASGGSDFLDGGAGDDQLVGDAALMLEFATGNDDTLSGGLGNDTVRGDAISMSGNTRGGNDALIGGDADDVLSGEAVSMSASARGGDDSLDGGTGNDRLEGDASTMGDLVQGGNDQLVGGQGNDFLFGDASSMMSGQAVGGNDTLSGAGGGNDNLIGDALSMSDSTRGGNDTLLGGNDGDLLVGDALALRDSAIGGDDRLNGGAGDDTLFGDGSLAPTAVGGHDTFIFAGAFGNDSVHDFRQGEDTLDFSSAGVAGIGALNIVQSGADTVIAVHDLNTVRLAGFTGTLTMADLVV